MNILLSAHVFFLIGIASYLSVNHYSLRKALYFFVPILLYLLYPTVDPFKMHWYFKQEILKGYLVVFKGFTLQGLTTLFVAYGVVHLFGFTLLGFFFSKIEGNQILKFSAAFSVGYLTSVGLLRVLTFFIPHAFISICTLIVLTMLLLLLRGGYGVQNNLRVSFKSELVPFGFMVFGFFFILVVNVWNGENHYFTGHGQDHYAYYLSKLKNEMTNQHFPLIWLHFDEIIFNYFLSQFESVTIEPVLLYWFTNSLMKISVACLFYLLFFYLHSSRAMALIGVLFIFLGTLTLNPLFYPVLLDSHSPLYFTYHAGRVVTFPVFFMVLFFIFNIKGFSLRFLASEKVFWFLLGLGLAATPVHNFIYWAILIPFFICVDHVVKMRSAYHVLPRHYFFTIPLFVIPPFLAYNFTQTFAGEILFVSLMTSAFILVFCFLIPILKDKKMLAVFFRNPFWTRYLFLLIPMVLASGLFGNLFSDNSFHRKTLDHFHKIKLLESVRWSNAFEDKKMPLGRNTATKLFFFNKAWDKNLKNEIQYMKGGLYFVSCFAIIYCLALFSLYLLLKDGKNQTENQQWASLLISMLVLLLFCFFYADFVDDIPRSWAKSRFFEYPIYGILFVFFITIGKWAPKIIQNIVIYFSAIHIIGPILGTYRFNQWKENLKFILARIIEAHGQ